MSPKHADSSSKRAAPPPRDKNALPAKEQNLFKSVVRLYETKQLKKALKSADTILKKFPDHGETLAMKGLTLNALDKKNEATELVRQGLRMDMKSHVCWHVYGLLYRSKRDYREAAKAYLNALRIEKDNQQILRDLALLQVQIRDYEGLIGTRHRLLTVRPNQQNNWIGFALSYHLLGNFKTAISVLDAYHETLSQSEEQQDKYEMSELLLYKNMLLEEGGQFSDALTHLSTQSPRIVDRLAVMETRARLYAAQGDFETAQSHFQRLINFNPDNHAYLLAIYLCILRSKQSPDSSPPDQHDGTTTIQQKQSTDPAMSFHTSAAWCASALQEIKTYSSDDDVSRVLAAGDEIAENHPYSYSAQRIALDILPSAKHPQFLPRMDSYVRRFLSKGIPSLFSDLKPLYTDESKSEAIGQLFESFLESLEGSSARYLPPLQKRLPNESQRQQSTHNDVKNGEINEEESSTSTITTTTNQSSTSTLSSMSASTTTDTSSEQHLEPPCTLLWVLHFLAQHYDRTGYQRRALDTIKRALQHTPTAIECYLVQARILKHLGDFNGATECANDARTLDLADRYLNTKCCKHALRADRVSDAEQWVSLFTRDADTGRDGGSASQALYDMQCIWFETGAAESYLRRGKLAMALKKLTSIERMYADMVEDQFDFHSYCLRKVTLRAYITLLRFEDRIRRHPFFTKGGKRLVECLLRIGTLTESEKKEMAGDHGDIEGYAQMTAAQKKKAISKRKKQMLRQKQSQGSNAHGGRGSSKHSSSNADADNSANDTSSNSGGGANSGGSNTNDKSAKSGVSTETDPSGVEALKDVIKGGDETILRDASRLTGELRRQVDNDIGTHTLTFEVYVRRRKALAALRAVRRAQRLNADEPDALRIAARFAHEMKREKGGLSEGLGDIAKKVIEAKGDVLGGLSIDESVTEYEKRNKGHGKRLLGAGRVRLWMAREGIDGAVGNGEKQDVASVVRAMKQIVDKSSKEGEGGGTEALDAPWCRELLHQLTADKVPADALTQLKECFRRKFSLASCFP